MGRGRPSCSRRVGGNIEGCEVVQPVQNTMASLSKTELLESVMLVDDVSVIEARCIWMSLPSATISMNFSSWTIDTLALLQKRLFELVSCESLE